MRSTVFVAFCLATALPDPCELNAADPKGPLADYLTRADDSYQWVKRREGEISGHAFVELTLTSQTWRDIVWKHQLFILKPAKIRDSSRALLLIGGGNWREELAGPVPEGEQMPREAAVLTALATQIGAPVAVLLHVPQQPLFGDMTEDEIISYTFDEYLKTGDATWPLLLPMVKSAVRGMDAVVECARQEWSIDIQKFTVTGASKRGWTTWLAGAADPRVQAIAPMVIDVLNMAPQMKHQLKTWGKFSEEIEDYTRRNIQERTNEKSGDALRAIVDPYSYRQVLELPKLIVLGTNDRYWPLDSLNLYWNGLQGEKRVLYVPNNGHGLRDLERVVGTIAAFHRQAAGELTMPHLSWRHTNGGDKLSLAIESDTAPARVAAWVATSPTRDFRDAEWSSQPAVKNKGGWHYDMPVPSEGFAALFGEAVFGTNTLPYFLSTNVQIVGPDGVIDAALP